MLKGVTKVEPGYAGGDTDAPTYEEVSSGTTGHAEVIRITYDPALVPYEDLLTVFFGSHDPTTLNRQGADVGTQYRSVIFYADETEKVVAEKYIQDLQSSEEDSEPIVTEVVPLVHFFPAEDYHQNYFKNNSKAPYCMLIIEPKLETVRARFAQLVHSA